MRKLIDIQTDLFKKSIDELKIDLDSRDEMPATLLGLRELYRDPISCSSVLRELEKLMPNNVDRSTGRSGMDMWHILVLGMVRLSHNCDYDKLTDLTNNHKKLRIFLDFDVTDDTRIGRRTIIDNISFFTPEILEKINLEVVKCGYRFLDVDGPKKCRADSFVLETDVHYPTDITLIWDCVRTIINLVSKLCDLYGISGWREHVSLAKKIHHLMRTIQTIRKGKPQKEKSKKAKRKKEVAATKEFHLAVNEVIKKADASMIELLAFGANSDEINTFISKAKIISSQLIKRVIEEEKIPHSEKIFSVFEEYTEWISKGKAGVSEELGVRIGVVEGDYNFILNWNIMYQKTDEKIAVDLVKDTIKKYPTAKIFSFDKGFWTPQNKKDIGELIPTLILPQKGRESKATKEQTLTPEYRKLRFEHSRIESAINALENHGLDRCYDKGKPAFERYVGLAIVARNILQLGKLVMAKERNRKIAA